MKKTMLGNLNCAMDKIDRDGENKTQALQVLLQLGPVKTNRG